MKKNPSRKRTSLSFAIVLIILTILAAGSSSPLHAGLLGQINERLLLMQLIGEGQFIGYQRNVDTKDLPFPVEVCNDGFKMIRVYQDFPGNYRVEWAWRVLLKNKSSRMVEITLEYKLQDQDGFLVVSSKEFYRKIAVGETVLIEKTDYLRYDEAKRVMNSSWHIHFQN
jgi:hypothetical protein